MPTRGRRFRDLPGAEKSRCLYGRGNTGTDSYHKNKWTLEGGEGGKAFKENKEDILGRIIHLYRKKPGAFFS